MSGDDTFAKVGGPPDYWNELDVIDCDTGEKVKDVVTVDCLKGFAFIIDHEETERRNIGVVQYRKITGNFRLERHRDR